MVSSNPLSLDLLNSKPQAAAQVLQSMPTAQAASYLETVPVRTLGPVLQHMETWPAAQILDEFEINKNAALFSQIAYRSVAALLRLQDEQRRADLLELLPAKLAKPLARSLSYQENTVGAWMDMSTPHFFAELSAWECLALLKKIKQPFGCTITVVNQNHHIVGVVTLDTLLISSDETELSRLLDPSVEPLPAEMSLGVACKSHDWHGHSVLPVRSGTGTYLGSISRLTLHEALSRQKVATGPLLEDSVIAQLGRAMIASTAGLMNLTDNNAELWNTPEREQKNGL